MSYESLHVQLKPLSSSNLRHVSQLTTQPESGDQKCSVTPRTIYFLSALLLSLQYVKSTSTNPVALSACAFCSPGPFALWPSSRSPRLSHTESSTGYTLKCRVWWYCWGALHQNDFDNHSLEVYATGKAQAVTTTKVCAEVATFIYRTGSRGPTSYHFMIAKVKFL